MGIFVEEAAAFIIGGLIGAAILYTKGIEADLFRLILFVLCLGLALFGILDVLIDHVGADEPQAATP